MTSFVPRGGRWARRRWRNAVWLACFTFVCTVHAAVGDTVIDLRCDKLSSEQAAAFEARARGELIVRGKKGHLSLECPTSAKLSWRAEDHGDVTLEVEDLSTDTLLLGLVELLDRPPPSVETPSSGFQVRGGTHGALWDSTTTIGIDAGLAWRTPLLTPVFSGHITRSLVSYSEVTLYLWEARGGVELRPWSNLGLTVAAGLGQAFTTSLAATVPAGDNTDATFAEGYLDVFTPMSLSRKLELRVGANVAGYSRRVRLIVNQTRGFDFRWQPGVFLALAFDAH